MTLPEVAAPRTTLKSDEAWHEIAQATEEALRALLRIEMLVSVLATCGDDKDAKRFVGPNCGDRWDMIGAKRALSKMHTVASKAASRGHIKAQKEASDAVPF